MRTHKTTGGGYATLLTNVNINVNIYSIGSYSTRNHGLLLLVINIPLFPLCDLIDKHASLHTRIYSSHVIAKILD
jgi:hypothetical protein